MVRAAAVALLLLAGCAPEPKPPAARMVIVVHGQAPVVLSYANKAECISSAIGMEQQAGREGEEAKGAIDVYCI